jgi:hypothetical protein
LDAAAALIVKIFSAQFFCEAGKGNARSELTAGRGLGSPTKPAIRVQPPNGVAGESHYLAASSK